MHAYTHIYMHGIYVEVDVQDEKEKTMITRNIYSMSNKDMNNERKRKSEWALITFGRRD
jgi:hypothetical protein